MVVGFFVAAVLHFTATICQYLFELTLKCYLTIWHLFVETHVHWGWLGYVCACWLVRVVLIQLASTFVAIYRAMRFAVG